MTQITTTLAEIRSHRPCEIGFAKIRDHLGVSPADAKTHTEPFPISLLLETNGLDDALWVTAHVAPDALTCFLIRRLDEGKHSALKVMRSLSGDWSQQIEMVERVANLLRRKLAGEDVHQELADTAHAARAARTVAACAASAAHVATYAAALSADAALSAYAADAADDDDAADAAYDAAYAAADAAAFAARAGASGDLIAALEKENDE